jgi:acetylornithine deacetylase/succinyl-diaminopimelate desuccinylase-like protein
VFIGQLHSGEIYNQYPQECMLEGTRRWLPSTSRDQVEGEFRGLVGNLSQQTGTQIAQEFRFIRDAFYLDQADSLVSAFQESYQTTAGQPLPMGPKPFVDDGNSFWGLAKVPAITHGPKAGGQHTVHEWVSIQDLERVALVYALTAVTYCRG